MKILLIDDEADKGWAEVLKAVLNKGLENEAAFEFKSVCELYAGLDEVNSKQYDLILLDLRFGESDHSSTNIRDYGGYKLLESIRNRFYGINFPTPVLLITATNKVWNIFSMFENGIDDFYIKEHPDFASDAEFSQKNYTRLLKSITNLKVLAAKRREVWNYIVRLRSLCERLIPEDNIRHRVEEKLKIGYGILFRKVSDIERQRLLFNKEVIAYIVFWSILEEISHSFYRRENEKDVEWKLAANGKSLQWLDSDGFLNTKFYKLKDENIKAEEKEYTYSSHQVPLSNQISGILRCQLDWSSHRLRADFLEKLNAYRNKVDFIHSSTDAILKHKLADNQDSEEAYRKCTSMLSFIEALLKESIAQTN